MSVTVRLPEELQAYADAEVRLNLDHCTIDDALRYMFTLHPKLASRVIGKEGRLQPYLKIFLNDQLVDSGHLSQQHVADGDTLVVFALAAGG